MKDLSVTITPGSIITAILFVLLVAVLWVLKDLVLIMLTAIVIASAMEPAVRFLMQYGVARVLAVIAMYLGIASIFFSVLFFFIPLDRINESKFDNVKIDFRVHHSFQSFFNFVFCRQTHCCLPF